MNIVIFLEGNLVNFTKFLPSIYFFWFSNFTSRNLSSGNNWTNIQRCMYKAVCHDHVCNSKKLTTAWLFKKCSLELILKVKEWEIRAKREKIVWSRQTILKIKTCLPKWKHSLQMENGRYRVQCDILYIWHPHLSEEPEICTPDKIVPGFLVSQTHITLSLSLNGITHCSLW